MTSVVGIRSLPSLIRLSGESLPICMCRHLSLLNNIPQRQDHSYRRFTSPCNPSILFETSDDNSVSSAYNLQSECFISAVMSLMYSRNRSGPRTDHYGTPEHTSNSFDNSPLAATTETLSLSQSLIQSIHSG